jgi:regulatory protein
MMDESPAEYDAEPDGDAPATLRGRSKRRRGETDRTPREPRAPRPIDAAQLQEMALGYAARYSTTAARLRTYLVRKLRERGWSGDIPPDTDALIARITALGYVDDRAFAAARTRDLAARGFGARRVRAALSAAGVSRDDVTATFDAAEEAAEADPDGDNARAAAYATAIAFARRRRFGPFARDHGDGAADPARQRRELAAMARAGHDFDVARHVLDAHSEAEALALSGE